MSKINFKKRGFSLLELVLAIAIFSLSSFTTAYLIIEATRTTDVNSKKIGAMLLAKEGIDALRSIRDTSGFSALSQGDSQGLTFSSGWSLSGSPDVSSDSIYTRTISISAASGDGHTKTATSSVTADSNNRTVSATLVTQFTDWR